MSFTVERNAPAPASVGRSQLRTTAPATEWPSARCAIIAGVNVIRVSFIPSGLRIRSVTSAS